jgi:hypothetical protein
MKFKSYPFLALSVLAAVAALWPGSQHQQTQSTASTDSKKSLNVRASYAQLPLSFEANTGQLDERVNYLARGAGYTIFLTGDEAVLALKDREHGGAVIRLQLDGANTTAKIEPADQLPGKSNYFIGNDPKLWRTDIPLFGKVRYRGVYPGIDVVYHGNQRQLEYDFVLAPKAS